jgi:putative PIN family toxin of toxin-antitoxin system
VKVLIDTNVWLSYLIPPSVPRAIATVVNACFTQDEIDVLVPCELIAELAAKVATKRYFRSRIPHATIDAFIQELSVLAEFAPPLEEIPEYSRDPKDDYLVAYGVVNEADYVITGDLDLLVLGQIGKLQIVKPSDFVSILKEYGLVA